MSNWYNRQPDGNARLDGRYDGPALMFESSMNNELLVTLEDFDTGHTWGYFNALDVLEAVIDRARVADPEGSKAVIAKELAYRLNAPAVLS